MDDFIPIRTSLVQLAHILKTPLIELDLSAPLSARSAAKAMLEKFGCCTIIYSRNSYGNKVSKLISLRRRLKTLEVLKHFIYEDNPNLTVAIIAIYPSINEPICVYEIGTNADSYVTTNVLPVDPGWFKRIVKMIIGKFVGVHPAVGSVALSIYKD
ncbi:hypothetical protein [Marinobacter piscensis]|uniref:hypothetical protein n=1 Tax=Marinobacter piscensis TaxID=1562308 RepID=UPI0011AAC594|nr:hypothetical protein [Marinobacter piscensis]